MRLGLDYRRLLELTNSGEPVIRVGSRTRPSFIVNHPDAVRHVLLDRRSNYDKQTLLNTGVIQALMGRSLLNSEGDEWARQRQAAHRLLGAASAPHGAGLIVRQTELWLERWDRFGHGTEVLTLAEMSRLALHITGQLVFQLDLTDDIEVLIRGLDVVVARLRPMDPEFRAAIGELHTVARTLFDRCLPMSTPLAEWARERLHDTQGDAAADVPLELLGLILTSYETTSIALTWTLMLLAQHADTLSRAEREIDEVFGSGPPMEDRVLALDYIRATIEESLRLYPPAWSLLRRAVAPDTIAGVTVPANAMVAIYPFTLHRHPAFWHEPGRFNPDRFLADAGAERPPFVYIPFGAGPRVCVGARLAMMEMPIMVAVIARRWRLRMIGGRPVELETRINLRPKGDLPLRLERRLAAP